MFSDWKEGWNVEIHHIFSGLSATDLQVAILQVLLGEKKASRECGFLHACVLPTEHQRMFPASASVTQLIKEENMCHHTTKCSKALILSICTVIYLASFHWNTDGEIAKLLRKVSVVAFGTSMKIHTQQNNKQERVSAFQHVRWQ